MSLKQLCIFTHWRTAANLCRSTRSQNDVPQDLQHVFIVPVVKRKLANAEARREELAMQRRTMGLSDDLCERLKRNVDSFLASMPECIQDEDEQARILLHIFGSEFHNVGKPNGIRFAVQYHLVNKISRESQVRILRDALLQRSDPYLRRGAVLFTEPAFCCKFPSALEKTALEGSLKDLNAGGDGQLVESMIDALLESGNMVERGRAIKLLSRVKVLHHDVTERLLTRGNQLNHLSIGFDDLLIFLDRIA